MNDSPGYFKCGYRTSFTFIFFFLISLLSPSNLLYRDIFGVFTIVLESLFYFKNGGLSKSILKRRKKKTMGSMIFKRCSRKQILLKGACKDKDQESEQGPVSTHTHTHGDIRQKGLQTHAEQQCVLGHVVPQERLHVPVCSVCVLLAFLSCC